MVEVSLIPVITLLNSGDSVSQNVSRILLVGSPSGPGDLFGYFCYLVFCSEQ